jgi:hypothetical protein
LNIVFSGAKKKKKKILFGVPILQFLLPPWVHLVDNRTI